MTHFTSQALVKDGQEVYWEVVQEAGNHSRTLCSIRKELTTQLLRVQIPFPLLNSSRPISIETRICFTTTVLSRER